MTLTLRGGLGNQILQLAYMLQKDRPPTINTNAVQLRNQLANFEDVRYYDSLLVNYCFGGMRKLVSMFHGKATDIVIAGYYDGYFQYGDISRIISENLAEHLVSQIHCDTTLENEIDVVVHIRGGDYFTESAKNIYAVCGASYYLNALEQCRKILDKEKIGIYIVTNDREHARSLLTPLWNDEGLDFIEYEGDEWRDFSLIYRARIAIIPNSTFSMTARMLRMEGMTFAPKQWFLESSGLRAPYSSQFTYLDVE